MTKFYTYAKTFGNNILYRGYENGKQIIERVPYKPTLYVPSKDKNSKWKSLYDSRPLEPIKFADINDAKDYVKTYSDVSGMEIHGFTRWEYQLINEYHPGEFDYDLSQVRIHTIDIETVDTEVDGFPDIELADVPIVLISIHDSITDEVIVLGLKDYVKEPEDNFTFKCFNSEQDLLKYFIAYTQLNCPDIWTGWNTDYFDIPYIVNRIMRVLGESMAKKLSPFNFIREVRKTINKKDVQTYEIYGIVSLDYLELYKKYGTYSNKESYALGFIAEEELGESKLEMPGKSFRDNYNNYYQTFVQYNAHDSILVKKMEKKLKLIELAFAMAYMYHCNINDIYRTVLPWEVFIFNHLAAQNIAVPPRKKDSMEGAVEGAWVKVSQPGMHKWVMSFDFKGLYPHVEWQWNISPETFVAPLAEFYFRAGDFLDETKDSITAIEYAKEKGYSIAANGAMFKRDKQGFLPQLMQYCIEGRNIAKDKMLLLEQEYETTKNKALLPLIAALDNKQKALKIAANACYGALGNKGFHYYDYRMAEAITITGQYSDRHLANALNAKFNQILKTVDVDYVIYGDSVTGDSMITVNGESLTISEFYEKCNNTIYADDFNKSYVKPCTDAITPCVNLATGVLENKHILHVMKHRVKKELFKITIGNDSVIVTADHSIIVNRDNKLIEIKPKDILKSDILINIKS